MNEQPPFFLDRKDQSQTRPDGSAKGMGWLGPYKNASGDDVTEYSIGVEIDGKQIDIPVLVPGLSDKEIKSILKASEYGEFPHGDIIDKAVNHARKMLSQGKSPFKEQPMNLVQKPKEFGMMEGLRGA
jgi:hypothetical protein